MIRLSVAARRPLRCISSFQPARGLSSKEGSSNSGTEWRKKQLQRLEKKFEDPVVSIASDEDLQPVWKEMESRVKNRRPRTVNENGGKTGRHNVKRTDEEVWLEQGLYDEEESSK